MKYKNMNLPISERVEDLLSHMTLDEKFWQLFMIPGDLSDGKEKYMNGIFGFQVAAKGTTSNITEQILDYSVGSAAEETAKQINEIQKFFMEETRLGIPIIPFDETLHGLIRKGATAFPQSIGLAASWNTDLMNEVASAIAEETKSRGIRQSLSPVVNIARDVRWGRTEETYGEDPVLTRKMGTAYISAFENSGVISTPKHFAVNVGDGGRDSYPIHYNERLLEEIYFPAFKASFKKAGARSVMTAYNSLDGRQCTANNYLLNEKLKKEWQFGGFVITDAGAIGGASVLHFTAEGYDDATAQAFINGLDVIFQTSYDHYPLFMKAFKDGLIPENVINNAVRRVLKAKFELGLFENPYVDPENAGKINGCKKHRELTYKAACESIVLLKNKNSLLPISDKVKSIAVIGQDADEARLGGYSGPGINPVSILDGLRNRLNSNVEIKFSPGVPRLQEDFTVVPSEYLSHFENGRKVPGLTGEYFNNIELSGKPDLIRNDDTIDFGWTLFSPEPDVINFDFYSVRWTGILKPSESGIFNIGLTGDDGYRLYIDGELLIDNWHKQTFGTFTKPYQFSADRQYEIKVEFFESTGNARLKLIWNHGICSDTEKLINDAVQKASESDIAIIAAGIEEGEFRDRAMLSLPGKQEELIRRIAETGTPVIILIVGGSAVTMNNWLDNVDAVLHAWYPGEEGGNAVADTLIGVNNPAGRLPVTFPISEAQLPLYYNHKPTGRGDDYNNLTGKPLFPFGFGLSYTNFRYSDIVLQKNIIDKNESIILSFSLSNIGSNDGEEVVQLYIRDLLASVAQPVMQLQDFKRVHLKSGETKTIEFEIKPDMLTILDESMNRVVETGEFRLMVGASSNDIRLRAILTVN